MKNAGASLEDVKVPVRLKISALWVSTMLCYIYGDIFWLYEPGKLQQMLEGKMAPLGKVTQVVLLGTSAMMAVPALMVFLSLVLKPNVSRWSNVVVGVLYTAIIIATMPGAWVFYLFLGSIEVVLTSLIVWYAWKWPRLEAS